MGPDHPLPASTGNSCIVQRMNENHRKFTDFTLLESTPDIYANTVIVWCTHHEFTLDCGILPDQPDDDTLLVTARVRIPPTAVFDLTRTLSSKIGEYEDAYGRIVPDTGIELPDSFFDYDPGDESDDKEGGPQ